MMMRYWLVPIAAVLASGCATVETRPLGSGARGIAYQLPLGKMRLRVVESDGVVSVLLDGPLVSGDPDHVLVATLPQSGVADNNVTVTVDGKSNLLSKVEVTSTGRLTEILTNAAKSAFILQASDSNAGTTVFSGIYSVDDLASAAEAANAKLAEYFDATCGDAIAGRSLPLDGQLRAVGQDGEADKTATKARLLRCRKMVEGGVANAARGAGLIKITVATAGGRTVAPGFAGARAVRLTDTQACAKGICYRPYRPRMVTLDVRGAFSLSDVFLLPDADALIHVDLPSGVTAEQKYTLDFTDGVLTKYQRDGKSELVGIAALPFKVVEAALAAPATALGLRQKDLEARANYLEAVGKLVDKQVEIGKKCADAEKAATCPDTAYKLIGGALTPDAKPKGVGDSDPPPAPPPVAQPETPKPPVDGAPDDDG